MLQFTDIKIGKVVTFNSQPYVILTCDFLKMNRGKPTKKCKMKNLVTGNSMEYNFKSGEAVEEADLKKIKATYMYQTGNTYSFMTLDTFETVDVDVELLGGKEIYLTEGLESLIVYYNDNPIVVDIPIKVSLKVTHAEEAAKGNTVSDVYKNVTVENGTVLQVPAFIKTGDYVLFNTVEGEYAGRDTDK